jgi:hypothetical protein
MKKKYIIILIGVITAIILFYFCTRINVSRGFGLSKTSANADVGNFPDYFIRLQAWAKKNNFSLKSTQSEKGKVIEIYNGSFRSIGSVSMEISTSDDNGNEFIMVRVNIAMGVKKTEKTTDDMNAFQSLLQKIIKFEDNKENPG